MQTLNKYNMGIYIYICHIITYVYIYTHRDLYMCIACMYAMLCMASVHVCYAFFAS